MSSYNDDLECGLFIINGEVAKFRRLNNEVATDGKITATRTKTYRFMTKSYEQDLVDDNQ
jgi:hypothetical protein